MQNLFLKGYKRIPTFDVRTVLKQQKSRAIRFTMQAEVQCILTLVVA